MRGKKIWAVTLILLSVILIWYYLIPSQSDKLTKGSPWCVNSIYYKGRLIEPRTLHVVYMLRKDGKVPCVENISFDNDGSVQLPGINSRAIAGEWMIDSTKKLQLNVDTLQYIYQGNYTVNISGDTLVLKSKNTIIEAHR